jgi:tetratricopeptide (TPR) repeat protein
MNRTGEIDKQSSARNRNWLLGLLLLIATFLAYQPAWDGQPVWDDAEHITKPALRSVEALPRIWTEPGATQQYYPLVHSIFWLEYRLWGDATLGYHLVNILLHALSALLLVKILRKLAIPGAWLAAAIFAMHPIEVESVAWISELKNTLSGFIYLAALAAYLRFDTGRKWPAYALALGLFSLGLLSKTVIATLPAALLVIFWWKRGNLSWRRDVTPLIPFFLIGIAAGLFTVWMEHQFIGAHGDEYRLTLVERMLLAGRVFWFYLGKLLWPAELIFIYPRWEVSQSVWWQYLFPAAALALLSAAWALRKKTRTPLAALLLFGGTLFPVLGFFNVYPFRYSFVADHFQYLAGLAIIVLLSAGIATSLERRRPWGRHAGTLACAALLAILAALTWRQSTMYADMETLWTTTLQRNPPCPMAHNNLGLLILRDGRAPEAMDHFQKVLDSKPRDADAHNNMGVALLDAGRTADAMAWFHRALASKPRHAEAHNNLGNALLKSGRATEAISHFDEALKIDPGFSEAAYNLANALTQSGQIDEAIIQFLGALRINPGLAEARINLGAALQQAGRTPEAMAQYQKALEIDPASVPALYRLAWVCATSPDPALRDGARAVELAERANVARNGENPLILGTLAAGYAEAGRFDDAVRAAERAVELSAQLGETALAAQVREHLRLYRTRLPYHEQPLHPR